MEGVRTRGKERRSDLLTLFLAGDVMTGRGVDQALRHPGDPALYESGLRDARGYVRLAEEAHGSIGVPVDFDYVWGDALEVLDRRAPDLRIVNLETAVTTSDDAWPGKPIHYRMHPDNLPCLVAAGIDACSLANNHVLDWGVRGLEQTLDAVRAAGIHTAGAGRDLAEARIPAVLPTSPARVLLFAYGMPTSGVGPAWAASPRRPGVRFLPDLSAESVREVADDVRRFRREGDVVIASIHWRSNWGYGVPRPERAFARRLVDEAGVDVVHGHSAHHALGLEVHRERPILYGCGDLVTDYEGIGGREAFRPDLSVLYFLTLDPATARVVELEMVPLRLRRFRLNRVEEADFRWMWSTLDRECQRLGARVVRAGPTCLALRWHDVG